jgi:EmrB/QacA subfamily drug resistance transporter
METTNTRWLLALLFTGTLMGALDLAIIGPALPVIQAEFDMQQRGLAGLINAYTLLQMLGALLLAKMADRHGPRVIYIISILLFAAGSLLLVIAETEWTLYIGRALQGFGAGGVFPASAAVIGARLAPAQRGQALGILGMVWGVAFIAGPILGGIFLRFSWQWLFAINLPIAAILIVGAIKLLPTDSPREPMPFDLKGIILLLVGMSALVFAVTSIDTNTPLESLLSLPIGGSLALFIVLSVVFWRIEKRAHDPIVRPSLFESAQITKSCLISAGVSALQSGTIFLPVLLVASLKVSPANSALLLLPGVIAATFAAPIIGKLINPLGTRLIIVVSQILVLGSLAIYAFTDLNYVNFLFASIMSGLGSAGLVGAPVRYIVLAETGNEDRASAQGLLSVTSSMGRLLGASVVGAVAASLGGGVIGYQAAYAGLVILGVLILFTAMTLNNKAIEQADATA